jgi:uncharacterized protein YggE
MKKIRADPLGSSSSCLIGFIRGPYLSGKKRHPRPITELQIRSNEAMSIRSLLPTAALFILSCSQLLSQAAGNSIYNSTTSFNNYERGVNFLNDSTMVIRVDALMNVRADSYIAILGIDQVGSTADSANMMMNERINGFINALGRLGVQSRDLYVDLVSQIPTYEYDLENKLFSRTYNEVPKGFDLKKNVHISFTKPEVLDDILLEASRFEIYDIVKVDYIVKDMESVYDSLRSAAVRTMGKKIRDFEKLGVKFLGMYQTVAENTTSTSPIERYASYSAFSSAALPQVRKSLLKSTTVNTAQKPVTIYYNKIPYNAYDIVINPNTLEPTVQFSYSLAMKYVLKKS